MTDLYESIRNAGILPVVAIDSLETAVPLAQACVDAGLTGLEITFRTECAAQAIRAIREAFPRLLLGAGTILSCDLADQALDAGADFLVTPGLNPKVVQYAQQRNVPILPGVTTPAEVEQAMELGLEVLKFFPAEQSGGLAKIKAMAAPFPMFKVMPTGGISLKNLKEYISSPVICACGGSYMVTADLIDNHKWDEIKDLCKKSVEIVKEARNG